jgi:hypothetical protein
MQTDAIVNDEKQIRQTVAFPRAGYPMREFAALFGKEKTWAYRKMYAGQLKVIPPSVAGEFMVPHSEVERLLSEAQPYSDEIAGKPVPRKATSKRKGQ